MNRRHFIGLGTAALLTIQSRAVIPAHAPPHGGAQPYRKWILQDPQGNLFWKYTYSGVLYNMDGTIRQAEKLFDIRPDNDVSI